jgi:hypothetical protein
MAKGRKSGGRTKGTPNRVTAEAREACAEIVDDRAYRSELLERARAGKLAPGVETMLWYYAKGRPREDIGVAGGGTVILSWAEYE